MKTTKRLIDELTEDFVEQIRGVVREELDAREVKPPAGEIMDLKQAAGYMGLHPKTLARRARLGKVPARRCGEHEFRFFRSELNASMRKVN